MTQNLITALAFATLVNLPMAATAAQLGPTESAAVLARGKVLASEFLDTTSRGALFIVAHEDKVFVCRTTVDDALTKTLVTCVSSE